MRALRLTLFALVAITACAPSSEDGGAAAEADGAEAATTVAADPLPTAEALGVENAAAPLPGLLTSAQISEEQLEGLREVGYGTFISLRPTSEAGAGWEEVYATEHGVSFDRIPVAGADDLTRENVETLDRMLDEAGEGAVLYCASSNRVGALLALRAYWLDGADPEEALELGRAAGMTRLEGRVTELLAEPR